MSVDTVVKELPNTGYVSRDPVELIPDQLIADVVLLVGKKAAGKSQMVAHWAACITNGKEFVPDVTPLIKGKQDHGRAVPMVPHGAAEPYLLE